MLSVPQETLTAHNKTFSFNWNCVLEDLVWCPCQIPTFVLRGIFQTISVFPCMPSFIPLPGVAAPEAPDCDISATMGFGSMARYRCWHTLRGTTRAQLIHTWQVLHCSDKKRLWLSPCQFTSGAREKQTSQSPPENDRNAISYCFPETVLLCLLFLFSNFKVLYTFYFSCSSTRDSMTHQ